jgi:hypothetical protein
MLQLTECDRSVILELLSLEDFRRLAASASSLLEPCHHAVRRYKEKRGPGG